MEEMKFKTNMKCAGCVEKIKPLLDADSHIEHWSVDLVSADKVVTVSAVGIAADAVAGLIKSAGFSASLVA
jgi:copper chaperone